MPLSLVRLLVRVRATLFGGRDRELRDEMELHLHLLEEEYLAQGMAPAEARRCARQDFGNATLYQEASHDLFSFRLLEDLAQDLRYALRELRRTAAFTTVAVVSLAVGIGAVTTTFTIVDAFMLRGLPVREPDRLVALSTTGSPTWVSWPYATFARWRTLPQAVVEVAAASDVNTVGSTRASQTATNTRVTLVSSNYFRVMGVRPSVGRSFEPYEDGVTSRAAVAVISDGLWAKAFARSPDILSRTIGLNGLRYSIVGVAERGFVGHEVGRPTDVWIPLGMRPVLFNETGDEWLDERATSGRSWLKVLGRVGPGIDLAQATAAANLARQLLVSEQSAVVGITDRAIARARTQQVALLPATKGFIVLTTIALLAALRPARSAAQVDPLLLLHHD